MATVTNSVGGGGGGGAGGLESRGAPLGAVGVASDGRGENGADAVGVVGALAVRGGSCRALAVAGALVGGVAAPLGDSGASRGGDCWVSSVLGGGAIGGGAASLSVSAGAGSLSSASGSGDGIGVA